MNIITELPNLKPGLLPGTTKNCWGSASILL